MTLLPHDAQGRVDWHEIAVAHLDEDGLWWRPNPASNSVGNLLLHLAGNLRQWVVSGLGGEVDERERESEFDPDQHPDRANLVQTLTDAVLDAVRTLEAVDPSSLGVVRTVQGREVTGFDAILHAVEHFSMHTGQILYITKAVTGRDLAFYEVVEGIPRERWR